MRFRNLAKFFNEVWNNMCVGPDLGMDSIQIIEDFASLVTDCMFAEKRRSKSSSTRVSQRNLVMFKPLIG
ncbi:hypothetical protein ANCDUO_07945 [Ancylostoma duodenale]|uniref:Uncharacterized protein n=1 Tax=Ancylostoma duodenale TaxID=51022 RepID=A0A0C2DH42_9BILA|nr:hypothetical protein ANCDUO_07945 [Ancylostoma duodenale]